MIVPTWIGAPTLLRSWPATPQNWDICFKLLNDHLERRTKTFCVNKHGDMWETSFATMQSTKAVSQRCLMRTESCWDHVATQTKFWLECVEELPNTMAASTLKTSLSPSALRVQRTAAIIASTHATHVLYSSDDHHIGVQTSHWSYQLFL